MTFAKRKKLVVERDKKCTECGSTEELTVDHIIPLSRGGVNSLDNLRTLCGRCNRNKASSIQWGWWERVQMALHIDDIIDRFRNDIKGLVSSNLGGFRNEESARIAQSEAKLRVEIKEKDHVIDQNAQAITLLHERLKTLESYLNIEYVKEVQTISIREYRKIKK